MLSTDPKRRALFTGVLLATMGVGTFAPLSLGILASVFQDDLGITRSQIGIAFAVNVFGAAALSPFVGRFTDRVGGRVALLFVAITGTISYLVYGIAGSFAVLIIGSVFGSLGQAGSNPSTNKLIAEGLPPGQQGVVTGIKQSGVQVFVFVGGLVVPSLALSFGRMTAYAFLAGVAVVVGVVAMLALPSTPAGTADGGDDPGTARVPADIWWLAGYGSLLGFAGSSVFLYVLFTEEQLGQSIIVGGLVAALVGVVAIPSRILWARHAERTGDIRRSLIVIALISVGAAACLLVADAGAWWFVWIAAVLTAVGSSSWNSVGMLGLIVIAGKAAAGRASGIVLSGFLAGLGIGPPLFGWIVDSTGSYATVWWLAAAASLAGAILMFMWRPTRSDSL
jgi:ACS family hexuronate transporter-like MFS transporter